MEGGADLGSFKKVATWCLIVRVSAWGLRRETFLNFGARSGAEGVWVSG